MKADTLEMESQISKNSSPFVTFLFDPNGQLTADMTGQSDSQPTDERLGRRTSKAGLFRLLVYQCGGPSLWSLAVPLLE